MKVIFLLLNFFSFLALADSVYITPPTNYANGVPIMSPITYQIYRDGEIYGPLLLSAPTRSNPLTLPSCEIHDYTATAIVGDKSSAKSNAYQTMPCSPSAPTISGTAGNKLLACQIDAAKRLMELYVCQAAMKVNAAK